MRDYALTDYDAGVLVAEKERANYYEAMIKDGADPKESANWLINEYLGRLQDADISQVPEPAELIEQAEPESMAEPTGPAGPPAADAIPRSGPTGPAGPPHADAIPPSGPTGPEGPAHADAVPRSGPTGPEGPPHADAVPRLGPTGPAANAQIVRMISAGEISRRMAKDLLSIVIRVQAPNDAKFVLQIAVRHGLRQVTDVSAIESWSTTSLPKNPDKVADAKKNPKAIDWFVGQVMKASGGKANPQAVNDLLKSKLGL